MLLPGLDNIVSPSLVNRAHPLARGLVGFWLAWPGYNGFGSSKWLDISGRNNHGTLTSMDPATDWSPNGITFDGTNQWVEIGPTPQSLQLTGVMTCLSRLSVSDDGNIKNLVSDYDTTNRAMYICRFTDTERMEMYWANGIRHTGTSQVPLDTKFDAAWVRSGGAVNWEVSTYINGSLDNTTSSILVNPPSSTIGSLEIGRLSDTDLHHLVGQIEYIALFNRALTQPEIKEWNSRAASSFAGILNRVPRRLYSVQAGATSIPIFMHHYKQLHAAG